MAPSLLIPTLLSRSKAPIQSCKSGFTGFFTQTGTSTPFSVSAISCTENQGVQALTERIVETLRGAGPAWGDHSVAVNARHKACLIQAGEFLSAAAEKLESGESPEFAAIELRSALDQIGDIVGKTDVEEILGEIFGQFCIGK